MPIPKPKTSETIVASTVFLDLVGFSKLSTTSQVHAKDRFNEVLRRALSLLGSAHFWVRDLGDGALIICPHSPEHALFLALRVEQDIAALIVPAGEPALAIRTGLHLGVLKTNPDLEGRPNYLGDGINSTQRVMDFAQPGQILASRPFVDAIAQFHGDYATMFLSPAARPDKHGRIHEVYTVAPSAHALARLQSELAESASGADLGAPSRAVVNVASPLAPDGSTVALQHASTVIKNWFIPVNALLFFAGILWTGFQRFGLSGTVVTAFGAVTAALGLLVWWVGKRRAASLTGPGVVLAAMGCMVGATGWISQTAGTPAATSTPIATPIAAPTSTPAPNSSAAGPTPAPALTTSQAAGVQAAPAVAPAVPGSNTPPALQVRTTSAPEPARSAKKPIALSPNADRKPPQSGTSERISDRCTVLLNKAALGETVPNSDIREMMQSCR